MFRALLAVVLASVASFGTLADAQTPAASVEQEASLPRVRQREATETTLISQDGLEYRILVSTPRGQAPDGGFPVFYVLDGDAFFATAIEIARMREWGRLSPSIIVGVAYPSRSFYDGPRRTYDFTPPGEVDPDFVASELGGANQFLGFLTNELKPWVAAHYRVDPSRQIIFGHSLAGMFVLHAMVTAPRSFDVYLVASPTLRFSNSFIVREVAGFAARGDGFGVRALITVGTLEGPPGQQQIDDYRRYFIAHPESTGGLEREEALRQLFPSDGFNKVRETRRLAQRLSRSGATVSFIPFEGEEHLPAGVSALSRGIPFALRPAH